MRNKLFAACPPTTPAGWLVALLLLALFQGVAPAVLEMLIHTHGIASGGGLYPLSVAARHRDRAGARLRRNGSDESSGKSGSR